MHKFYALLFGLFLVGCSALSAVLPIVNSAVTDTAIVLQGIDTVFNAYQASHTVSPADRAEYAALMATAQRALRDGSRVVEDGHDIEQGKYDQAFADFKVAYGALTAWLKKQGITPGSSGLVGAGTPDDAFLTPRVIGLRVAP